MARLPEASSLPESCPTSAWVQPPAARGSGASVRRAALGGLLGMATLGAVLWQTPAQAGNVSWSVGVQAPGVVVHAQTPVPVVVAPHPAHPVYSTYPSHPAYTAYPAYPVVYGAHPVPGYGGHPLAGHRPAVVVVTDPWARPHRHGRWHGHRHHHRDHHRGHGRGHGRDD